MPRYADMLAAGIDKSGKSLKQIVLECENLGRALGWTGNIQLDNTTLSRLRAGKQSPLEEPPPGDPVPSRNRLLAKVLLLPEEEFVLAAALQHTPVPVLKHVSVDLLSVGRDLHQSAFNTLLAARDLAAVVADDAQSSPALLDAAVKAQQIISGAFEKATEAATALEWMTFTYQESLPQRFTHIYKEVFKTNDQLIRSGTVASLARALAESAGIPANSVLAFVKAMQELETGRTAGGDTDSQEG